MRSDEDGKLSFTENQNYYFFIKETDTPKNVQKSNEIIPIYHDKGVRFIGEKEVSKMKVDEATDGQNLNEYLQSLTTGGESINSDTEWLVFNENGVEKLIPKLPIRVGTLRQDLNNLIYGDENPEYMHINGKKYVVRLMRGLSDRYDPRKEYENTSTIDSEYNRLILPIIGIGNDEYGLRPKFGRFGSKSKRNLVENMPVLAKYTWWDDFDGNNMKRGVYRITQNIDKNPDFNIVSFVLRGDIYEVYGAAGKFQGLRNGSNAFFYSSLGWQPLLEEVK